MSAQNIFERMVQAYAACQSYRDEGVVTTAFYEPRRRVERKWFSTRFVRPDGFRFEYRVRHGEDDWTRHVVWRKDGRPYSWWEGHSPREEAESLERALARAAGVSGGSAHRVPRMLIRDAADSRPIATPVNASVVESAEAEAVGCIAFEWGRRTDRLEQYWVDRSTYLIKRVIEPRHVLMLPSEEVLEQAMTRMPDGGAALRASMERRRREPPCEVESVTEYEPSADCEIHPFELVFEPPVE